MPSVHSIVEQKEFWLTLIGALVGALAAFAFAIVQRWWERRVEHAAAARAAIFSLSQMYTFLRNVREQWVVQGGETIRRQLQAFGIHREPLYFEYLPIFAHANPSLGLRLENLSFVLRSHDPDLLNRLAAAERTYLGIVALIERRNSLHERFQAKLAASGIGRNAPASVSAAEEAVGIDTAMQLKALTESLLEDIPRAERDLEVIGSQVSKAMKFIFPVAKLIGFEPGVARAFADGHHEVAPHVWRRLVRGLVGLARARRSRAEAICAAALVGALAFAGAGVPLAAIAGALLALFALMYL